MAQARESVRTAVLEEGRARREREERRREAEVVRLQEQLCQQKEELCVLRAKERLRQSGGREVRGTEHEGGGREEVEEPAAPSSRSHAGPLLQTRRSSEGRQRSTLARLKEELHKSAKLIGQRRPRPLSTGCISSLNGTTEAVLVSDVQNGRLW